MTHTLALSKLLRSKAAGELGAICVQLQSDESSLPFRAISVNLVGICGLSAHESKRKSIEFA